MKENVEQELDCLYQQGIIKPVQFSDWAGPNCSSAKTKCKNVRICGEYKLKVNQDLYLM